MLIHEEVNIFTGLRQRWYTSRAEADQAFAALTVARRGKDTPDGPLHTPAPPDDVNVVRWRVDDVPTALILQTCLQHGGLWSEGCGFCQADALQNQP